MDVSISFHIIETDKKQALERYLAQATYLHGGQSLIQKTGRCSDQCVYPIVCLLYQNILENFLFP